MNNYGPEIFNFAKSIWQIPRSITGNGVRSTLAEIKKYLPELQILSVPSGTQAFDWEVPKEWNVNDAYIITPEGKKICEFKINNLHLVGYSTPVNVHIELDVLQNHLHSIPEKPDSIPYVTSYYKENWGFCISQNQRNQLTKGTYQVIIDSSLTDGVLNYGELVIAGKSSKEIFLSTYICHPSMANNELSGPCLTTFLAKNLINTNDQLNYTYRVIFIPETIGSIVYLSKNLNLLKSNVLAGFNISCVGDERCYSFLPSRNGDTLSDRIALHILKWTDPNFKKYTWLDRGSDERQYCSPGIDLPISSIMRSKYGTYPEYHTSKDTLGDVVTANGLGQSYTLFLKVFEALEANQQPIATVMCEPQMGRRNLYGQYASGMRNTTTKNLMDFLSYADGYHSLLDIAEIINQPIWEVIKINNILQSQNLLIKHC